jgi:hypothetical protein
MSVLAGNNKTTTVIVDEKMLRTPALGTDRIVH